MKTFSLGGVHPHDNKISRGVEIKPAPLPTEAIIFTAQHLGAPAEPVVAKGDTVKVGQLIAKASGFISANVHSSVSGVVKSVDVAKDGTGVLKPAITITVEGDEWVETIDRTAEVKSECTLSPQEIVAKVAEAGIVGLGGATFPTNVKLCPPPDKTAEMLVINGVECEPYLTSDHRLMLEQAQQIVIGCQIVMRALGVAKCYIGIESNKPDAIKTMQGVATDGIEIVPLKVQYPQGGEKQLIDAVSGRKVPSGALPIEVGAVVQNIGTIIAIYEAVQKNKPLFERVTTITGLEVPTPQNLMVRVGTPINQLLEMAGVTECSKVINGGPMMGRAVCNTDAPTTKGTSGILVMPQEKALRPRESACIACAKCVGVCPMGLEPHLLYKISKLELFDRTVGERAQDCIECGCCSYTCPAGIPLLDYIRLGKVAALTEIRNAAAAAANATK